LYGAAFAEELIYRGQYLQDQYVYETFFKNKKNGVFVDIGAHDGISFSNTYFFEKQLGWTGLCVEPLPEIFQKLKANRRAICVDGCIYDQASEAKFLRVKGYAEMLSGVIKNYDPRHLARIYSEIASMGGSSEVITVKCYNLTQLLLDNKLTKVDYMSIDTEGGELEILKSIDFSQVEIDVLDVENNYLTPDFEAFLKPLGYVKVAQLGCDEVYKLVRGRN
jgi:FkbM family methyltransferase